MDDKSLLNTQDKVLREFDNKAEDKKSPAAFVRPENAQGASLEAKSKAVLSFDKSTKKAAVTPFITSASIRAKAHESGRKEESSIKSAPADENTLAKTPASLHDESALKAAASAASKAASSDSTSSATAAPSLVAGVRRASSNAKAASLDVNSTGSAGAAGAASVAGSDSEACGGAGASAKRKSSYASSFYTGFNPVIGVLNKHTRNSRAMSLEGRNVRGDDMLKRYGDKDQVRGIVSSQAAAAKAHRYAKDLLSAIDPSLPFTSGTEGIIMADMMKALATQSNRIKQRRNGNVYNYKSSALSDSTGATIRKVASATSKLDAVAAVAAVTAADEAAKLAKTKALQAKLTLEKVKALGNAKALAKTDLSEALSQSSIDLNQGRDLKNYPNSDSSYLLDSEKDILKATGVAGETGVTSVLCPDSASSTLITGGAYDSADAAALVAGAAAGATGPAEGRVGAGAGAAGVMLGASGQGNAAVLDGVSGTVGDSLSESAKALNETKAGPDYAQIGATKAVLRNGSNPLYASTLSGKIRDPFETFSQAKVGNSILSSLSSNTPSINADTNLPNEPRVTMDSLREMEDSGALRLSAAEQAAINRTSDDEISLAFERTFALGSAKSHSKADDDDYITDLNYGLFCSQDDNFSEKSGGLSDLVDAAMEVFGAKRDTCERDAEGVPIFSRDSLPAYIEGKVSHLPNADIYAFKRDADGKVNTSFEEGQYGLYGNKLKGDANSFVEHIAAGHAMPFGEFNEGENLSLEEIAREQQSKATETPYYRIEHQHSRNGYMPCYFIYDNSRDSYLLDEGTCRLLGLEYTGEWMDSSEIEPTMNLLDSDEVYKILFNSDAGNKLFSHVEILNGSHAGERLFMTGAVICRDEAGIALNVVFYLSQIEARYMEAVLNLKNHCSAYDIDIKFKEVHFGPAYKQMIGLRPDEEMPASIEEWERNYVHPEDISIYRKQSDVVITSDIGDYYETIYRLRHKGGYYIWCIDRGLVVQRTPDGRATRVIGTTTNIDIVRSNFERLKRSIYQDPLTTLHNRLYLNTRYKYFTLEECQPLSLVYADVSGLKVINDHLGHARGDELVKVAAKVLREEVDIEHEVIRLSGDEFLMIFTKCPNDKCKEAVAKLEERLEYINTNHKYSLPVYFGFGVATLNEIEDGDTFIRCEARADARLHEYKLKHHERIYSALKEFIEHSICCPIDLTDNRRLEYLDEKENKSDEPATVSEVINVIASSVAAHAKAEAKASGNAAVATAKGTGPDANADAATSAVANAAGTAVANAAGTASSAAEGSAVKRLDVLLDHALGSKRAREIAHKDQKALSNVDEEALIKAAEESAIAELNYAQSSMLIPDDLSASIDIELNNQGLAVVKVAKPSTVKSQLEKEHIAKVINSNRLRNKEHDLYPHREEVVEHNKNADGIDVGTELERVSALTPKDGNMSNDLAKSMKKKPFTGSDSQKTSALDSENAASNLFSLFQDLSDNGERDILSAKSDFVGLSSFLDSKKKEPTNK